MRRKLPKFARVLFWAHDKTLRFLRLLGVKEAHAFSIINFHELKLVDGVVRMILPGANRDSGEFKQKETKATKGTEASYM